MGWRGDFQGDHGRSIMLRDRLSMLRSGGEDVHPPSAAEGEGIVEHRLDRFVSAQDGVYEDVLDELRAGRKSSHWMWFIFPQVAGLGSSGMAQRYAIRSLEEARAYLAHPVLGARLRDCAGLLLSIEGRSAEEVLGRIDALKLQSSMTLFHRAAPQDPLFLEVLERYYDGVADAATDALLA